MPKNAVIMLVDDDADDRDFFCEALKKVSPSTQCIAVERAKDCVLQLDRMHAPPLVIFLDIDMSFINGFQLMSLLKESNEFKAIPVVMYSTSKLLDETMTAKRRGALDFFVKPSSFNEIKHVIQ